MLYHLFITEIVIFFAGKIRNDRKTFLTDSGSIPAAFILQFFLVETQMNMTTKSFRDLRKDMAIQSLIDTECRG